MNKRKKGRSLGREKDQKKALLRTLLVSLIEKKKIKTTLSKAKELKPFAERKFSIAKRILGEKEQLKLTKIRTLKKDLPIKSIEKLLSMAKESKRDSGYTRITKLMPRKSDFSEMAIIEWVDKTTEEKKTEDKKKTLETKVKKETKKESKKK